MSLNSRPDSPHQHSSSIRRWVTVASALISVSLLASCGAPRPELVEPSPEQSPGRILAVPGPAPDPVEMTIIGTISAPLRQTLVGPQSMRFDDLTIGSVRCDPDSGCTSADVINMASAGVDVVIFPQGSTLDGGDPLDVPKLAPVDLNRGLSEVFSPSVTVEYNGRSVFIITAAEVTPELTALVAARSQVAEHTVVFLTWSTADERAPSREHTAAAEALQARGADVIVGVGSNYLLRIEQRSGHAIAFGLGNSSSFSTDPLHTDTAMVEATLDTGSIGICPVPARSDGSGFELDDVVSECR